MNQPNTPASRTEQAVPSVASGAVDSLQLCVSDLRHSAVVDDVHDMRSCVLAVCNRLDALAAPSAAIAAREQEAKSVPMERIERLARGIRTAKKAEDSIALVAAFLRECALASRPEPPAVDAGEKDAARWAKMEALGWQRINCPVCGDLARAAPLPEAPPASASPATVVQPVPKPMAWLHYAAKKPSLRRVDFHAVPGLVEQASGWKTIPLGPIAPAAHPCASQGCAALRTIAEFPVTDEASNMDASNMRQIARAALSTDKGDGGSEP